nr:MAG: NUMOD4 motif protein [Bacteriophage sp.]
MWKEVKGYENLYEVNEIKKKHIKEKIIIL